MRGRDREQEIALGFVRDGASRHGGVLLIEGEPGIGKSGLLRVAADEAARRGFSLVAAAADELGRAVPFAPLLSALHGSFGPLPAEASYADPADMGIWLVDKFRVLLEQRAGDHPVLVSLDDLHWADRATLAALRALPGQLAAYPLVWQLTRSTAAPGGGADLLFDLLERDGADRVTLGPLSDDAVAGMVADVLHATPDAGLTELAAGAAGNPYLLVELLTGLREEDAIQVARGRATLISAQLPDRVQVAVRAWLGGLNRRVRPLLETAAVLGRSFRLEDVAEMLGEAPAALLPLLNEALQAGLLAAGTDDFSFRHGLVWQAVTESVPLPARLALHRQFGGMLLTRGGSAVAAGAHLLASARPGDTAAIAGLDQAAAEALGTAPSTAADLALRALELTAPADPARVPRSARAAESLAAAGRLADAENIARVALAQPLPAATAAPLRCAVSAILARGGHPEQADAMAESVLAAPGLAGRLRDEAMITQLHARAALRDTARSRVPGRGHPGRPGSAQRGRRGRRATGAGQRELGGRLGQPRPGPRPQRGPADQRDLAGRAALPATAHPGRHADRPAHAGRGVGRHPGRGRGRPGAAVERQRTGAGDPARPGGPGSGPDRRRRGRGGNSAPHRARAEPAAALLTGAERAGHGGVAPRRPAGRGRPSAYPAELPAAPAGTRGRRRCWPRRRSPRPPPGRPRPWSWPARSTVSCPAAARC